MVDALTATTRAVTQARSTITDPPALARAILDSHTAGGRRDMPEVKRDLDALTARDPQLGAQVATALEALLTPVERGELARAAYSVSAPDGQGITFRDGAPSIADYRAQAAGTSGRAFYDRLDGIWGDGRHSTDDTPAIQSGLRDLQASGLSLDEFQALRALSARPAELARSGDVAAAAAFMEAHPGQIDEVLRAFGETHPALVPQLLEAGGAAVQRHIDAQAEQPTTGNRVWGGLRAVGGGIEAVVGGALVLAPEPTMLTKVGGGVLAAHGGDNFVAGFRQMWSGLPTESLTQQGAEAVASSLGADPVTASRIGVGVDIGVGLAGSGLAALGRLSSSSRLVWGSIEATQPVHAGTVIPRSFELAGGGAKVWVSGNGTKHIAEYATAMLQRGVSPNLVNVASQVQLSSLQAAVAAATKEGVVLDKIIRVAGWELKFAAPRQAGQLPALIHALPL